MQETGGTGSISGSGRSFEGGKWQNHSSISRMEELWKDTASKVKGIDMTEPLTTHTTGGLGEN